ncbi:hypothetical protein [Bdellovibrio sp. HCB209]|uniref:hypothetical protein n=1 Tax=Bdellovibrio sp. HCB209 TaxID=3394354 RepID=UPI0039B431BD
MLKFTAKIALVAAFLGLGACATTQYEEPRSPQSVTEDESAKPKPWHYPFVQKGASKTSYY